MSDFKKRVQASVEKFSQKQLPKEKRTNNDPENQVVGEMLDYLRSINCSVHVFEAKSTYSPEMQRYISQSITPGHPDIAGNFPNGLAIYVEAKAPSKLKTLRPKQYDFLVNKISTNCFAVCVDSVSLLEKHIEEFRKSDNRKKYLLSVLPEPYKSKTDQQQDLSFED